MNLAQKNMLLLLRSAITGEKLEIAEPVDINAICREAQRHSILALMYEGAVNCGVDKSLDGMGKLLNVYYSELMLSEKQLALVKKICNTFDANGVDYVLLKGSKLKWLYPKPELRKMGDADILIHESDYPKARVLVEELGFSKNETDGDHSRDFSSKYLCLELHVRFVERHVFPQVVEYFDGIWNRVKLVEGHRYELTPEDEFMVIFIHFMKHFLWGGVGCRHICDLWVYLEKMPEIDINFVEKELESLHMVNFFKNTLKTIKVWFEGEKGDEKTDLITDFVLKCGSWGTKETHAIASGARTHQEVGDAEKVRSRTIWKTVFPSLADMRKSFTVLEKHPYLLPVFWGVRLVRALLFRRESIKRKAYEIKMVSAENVETHVEMWRLLGVELSE